MARQRLLLFRLDRHEVHRWPGPRPRRSPPHRPCSAAHRPWHKLAGSTAPHGPACAPRAPSGGPWHRPRSRPGTAPAARTSRGPSRGASRPPAGQPCTRKTPFAKSIATVLTCCMDGSPSLALWKPKLWHIDAVRGRSTPSLRGAQRPALGRRARDEAIHIAAPGSPWASWPSRRLCEGARRCPGCMRRVGPFGGNCYRAHKSRSPGIMLLVGRPTSQPSTLGRAPDQRTLRAMPTAKLMCGRPRGCKVSLWFWRGLGRAHDLSGSGSGRTKAVRAARHERGKRRLETPARAEGAGAGVAPGWGSVQLGAP
jgi:hypothetical protein